MKRRNAILFVCVAILLCGCGGLQRSNVIGAVGLFSGNMIELSVKNRQYPAPQTDGMTYFLDKPWKEEDFFKQTEKLGEVKTMQDGYVLFTDSGTNTYDAFYFPFGQGEHMVTNMSVEFVFDETRSGTEQVDTVKYLAQIPLYLFADERLTSKVQPKLYAGIEYEACSDDMDAFLYFYQHTGWYQVEKTNEDRIIISGYRTTPKREFLEDKSFDVPFPLELRFIEHYNTPYVSITVSDQMQ